MPQATWTTQVGIAKETTYGTGVAPTDFIPVENLKVDDKLTYVDDKAWRGAPVDIYDQFPGPAISDLSWDGPVYPDTIGYLLAGVLGSDDVTGSAAPYTHALTLNNTSQPKSYTVTDAVNGSMRQVSGVQFSEVSFKIDPAALVTYTAKGQGLLSTSLGARPVASYSAVRGAVGWSFTPTINGLTPKTIESAEVMITRAQTAIYTLGQQTAYSIYDGIVSCSGKLVVVMEDETQINNYLAGTYLPIDLAFSTGTGSAAVGVDLHMTKCLYKALTKDRSKDYVQLQIDFTALANTTDVGSTSGYSPLKVTLTNAKPSGTYM